MKRSLRVVLLVIVAAVLFSGCVHDPTLYPSVLYGGSYIRWAEPSPVTEYHGAYWEEKRQQAERRYQDALNRAREAGRNRAQEEELRRRGYWR